MVSGGKESACSLASCAARIECTLLAPKSCTYFATGISSSWKCFHGLLSRVSALLDPHSAGIFPNSRYQVNRTQRFCERFTCSSRAFCLHLIQSCGFLWFRASQWCFDPVCVIFDVENVVVNSGLFICSSRRKKLIADIANSIHF